MPDAQTVSRFGAFAGTYLVEPVSAYFEAVRRIAERPGPLSGIRLRGARAELAEQMVLRLERLHADAALLATGGRALTVEEAARLRQRFEEQARYMRAFVGQIDAHSELQAVARARSYVPAIVQTISAIATTGLPRLPYMPGDRRLACNGYCKCSLQIITLGGAGDFDVIWVLGDADRHCPDCLRLAAEWTPLRIRAGIVQNGKRLSPPELRMLYALAAIAFHGGSRSNSTRGVRDHALASS